MDKQTDRQTDKQAHAHTNKHISTPKNTRKQRERRRTRAKNMDEHGGLTAGRLGESHRTAARKDEESCSAATPRLSAGWGITEKNEGNKARMMENKLLYPPLLPLLCILLYFNWHFVLSAISFASFVYIPFPLRVLYHYFVPYLIYYTFFLYYFFYIWSLFIYTSSTL